MELLGLDEDSLMEIFSYFNFDQLLALSSVCQVFTHLCRRHLCKISNFELDYRSVIAREDYAEYLRAVFTVLGPTMKAFRFSGGYIMDEQLKQHIVDNLVEHCSALRYLTINYTLLSRDHLQSLSVLLRTLVHVDFGRCELTDEGLAEFLQGNPHKLRTLAIPGNTQLLGTFFKTWTTADALEQLDLSYCSSLHLHEMDSFLDSAKRVSCVDATGCIWLKRSKDIFQKNDRLITMEPCLEQMEYFKAG